MSSTTSSARVPAQTEFDRRERLLWLAAVAFCGLLPAVVVATLFIEAVTGGTVATDLRQFYAAAETILAGENPYVLGSGQEPLPWGGAYPYPPLPGLLMIPLTALPLDAAGIVVMATLVVVALATLRVLDVRDWRCYGIVLLWPPVISAIQTGNVTLWFGLALAITWRFRDRVVPVAATLAATLAVKFFLWPAVVWLAATRRYVAAAASCLVGAALLLLSWVPLGFAGFLDYPDLLRKLEETIGDDSYTLYIVGLDAGLAPTAARALWVGAGLALVAVVVVLGRRGDEQSAFLVAIAAALALTPIVWLHYFALLIVVVAIARPRLGALWFVPLAMLVTPGSGHPTPFETVWTLGVAAIVIGLALRESRSPARARSEPAYAA